MYADDHQLFSTGSNAYSMKARLESEAAKALTYSITITILWSTLINSSC